MSTDYLPKIPIPFEFIKGIARDGVRECNPDPAKPDHCVLTDGENYLHAHKSESGHTVFSRYGGNDASGILSDLEEFFGNEFVSEHDDRYQGMIDEGYRNDFVSFSFDDLERMAESQS